MKILITGAKGQLGTELVHRLGSGGQELPDSFRATQVLALSREELDIGDASAALRVVRAFCPELIINCAAYNDVDGCESTPDTAMAVNILGPRNLAVAAEEQRGALMHVSTDYVFSGDVEAPRREWDETGPLGVYGASKLAGEQYVRAFCTRWYIVRTAWLYGYEGKNFVKAILNRAQTGVPLKVVNDQVGSPTFAADLALQMLYIAERGIYGLYHCTNKGRCAWFDFAKEFLGLSGLAHDLSPQTSESLDRAAKRPAFSVMDNAFLRVAGVEDRMRTWQEAIGDFMRHYNSESGEFIR